MIKHKEMFFVKLQKILRMTSMYTLVIHVRIKIIRARTVLVIIDVFLLLYVSPIHVHSVPLCVASRSRNTFICTCTCTCIIFAIYMYEWNSTQFFLLWSDFDDQGIKWKLRTPPFWKCMSLLLHSSCFMLKIAIIKKHAIFLSVAMATSSGNFFEPTSW